MPKRFPDFEREGLAPFSYATKDGEHKLTSYWRMPDRLYDDPEELARWARARARARRMRAAAAEERKSTKTGGERQAGQATFADETEATSGSVSHMTRLRPQRLAA